MKIFRYGASLNRLLWRIFGAISGFNSSSMRRLELRDQVIINLLSYWGLIGILLCSFSTCYLVIEATGNKYLGIAALIFVLFVLIALQNLLVTSSGMELSMRMRDRMNWRPSIFRLLSFLIIGLFFSQPVIFSFLALTNNLNKNAFVSDLSNKEQSIKKAFENTVAIKNLEITKIQTLKNLVDINAPNVITRYQKHALIIESGKISSLTTQLINNLKHVGFKVSVISETHGPALELKVKNYYDQISIGHLSLVIYRGNGRLTNNNSFLLTNQSTSKSSDGLDFESLSTIISNKKPLASYFVFSISRFFGVIKESDKMNLPTAKDLFTVTYLNDQDGRLIESFSNEIIAAAELNDALKKSILPLPNKMSLNQRIISSDFPKLPIYLKWTPGLFYKKYEYANPESLLAKNDPCVIYVSYTNNSFSECISAKERILVSEIAFFNHMMKFEIENIGNLIKSKILKPSVVFNYFAEFWNNKLQTIILTILATLLISGGYILRDFYSFAIVTYESANNQESRVIINTYYKKYRNILRHTRENLRSNEEYFDNENFTHPFYKPNHQSINEVKNDDFYNTLLTNLKKNN